MKNILPLFFLALLSFSFATQSQAQDADEVIAAYLEVTNGAKWSEFSAMRMTGSSVNQGMEFPISVVAMRPNLQKVEVSIQGKSFVDSYDGEVAWSINPFMGGTEPTKKNEEETAEAALNNFEPELLNWRDKGHTVTYDGAEEVEGTDCHRLKLVKANGDEEYYFFDKETAVLIMQRSYIKSGPMKGQAVETYMSDYDEVNGIYIAFTLEQKVGGQTFMQMTAETIELDPEDLTKEAFAFPEK
ncbi:MAG: hypothetical protein KDC34_02070 [Saprospiraceae bacterium]|nr:hypothetical protein [Saprospiraceae bacterium]